VKSKTYRARQIHRWLGLFIGVQFVLWTVGGLYFSWVKLDDVHGDHLLHAPRKIAADEVKASPNSVIAAIQASEPVDSLVSLDIARVAGTATYRITYYTGGPASSQVKRRLADATTGALREPLTRPEAIAVARAAFTGHAPLTRVDYLTAGDVGKHHEYREQLLPAWAVSFGDEEGATLYIPAESGQVHRVRNNRWRTFDFLWMLHTMDYQGRDNFNNIILRAFSVLGLITVSSGLLLFVLTSKAFRRRQRAKSLYRLEHGISP
jgi:uncharacterized iron-regulated membrane protein